jgi:hypothetical protein
MADPTTLQPIDDDLLERMKRMGLAMGDIGATSTGAPSARTATAPTPIAPRTPDMTARPTIPASRTTNDTAPEIIAPTPANSGLQPIGEPTAKLQPLNFHERQALPTVSPGAPAGSAASLEAQLARREDQDANPYGSAENHPGKLGKLEHIAAKVGNIAGDIAVPDIMARVPGTELNRTLKEEQIQGELGQAQGRETAAKAQDTAAKREETGEKTETERERHNQAVEDALANKPAHVETPDEQAIDDKKKEINPKTGKNYTAYEANVALAVDKAEGKPHNTPAPKTITMLDKPGGKPFMYQYDPKGTYQGDEGQGNWKKIGPAQPNAAALGIVGSLTPLIDPASGQIMGTINTKTGAIKPIEESSVTQGGATTGTGARAANTRINQFNTMYLKPATDVEQNYRKFQAAYHDYQNNPQTGAASMVALAQHLGSTLGSVKGAAMGESMIQEHKDAIGLFDRIGRYADQLDSGQQLSAAQWKEFGELMAQTRQIQWETTATQANRQHQKVDMVPADVMINMQDSAGKVRHVPGNRVQYYLDQGAKLAE